MAKQFSYEDDRALILWNEGTKKITVSHKKARCSKQTFYGPYPLNDARDLVERLKVAPDSSLDDILKEWEHA